MSSNGDWWMEKSPHRIGYERIGIPGRMAAIGVRDRRRAKVLQPQYTLGSSYGNGWVNRCQYRLPFDSLSNGQGTCVSGKKNY